MRKNSWLPFRPYKSYCTYTAPLVVVDGTSPSFHLLVRSSPLRLVASLRWPTRLGCVRSSLRDAARGLPLGWCWSMPYADFTSSALRSSPRVNRLRLPLRPTTLSSVSSRWSPPSLPCLGPPPPQPRGHNVLPGCAAPTRPWPGSLSSSLFCSSSVASWPLLSDCVGAPSSLIMSALCPPWVRHADAAAVHFILLGCVALLRLCALVG